jgi:molybdopterin-containing oxidoreductase family membrane subunit
MAEHAHAGQAAPALTIRQIIEDATRRALATGARLATLDIVLAVLAVIGLVAIVINAITEGFNDLEPWGYTAIVSGYLLSSFMAAPILAVLLRLTRSDWRRPLSRIAEIQAAAGIVVLILYIPVFLTVPEAEGRFTVWVDWPWGAPAFFDLVLLILLVFGGYAFLYLSAMPDFAIVRDRSRDDVGRFQLYARLANGWQGSLRQWSVLRPGLGVLGAAYLILYVWTVSIFYWDFALALLPSWRSAVFPAFAVMSSLQTGLALIIVTMYVLRRWGGMEEYLTWDYFWSISKLLLTTSLLWFYLWISEFMIFWYGRLPGQINVLEVVMFDVYFVPMLLAFFLNFVLALLILMWNRVRKTVGGPTLVACLVLTGTMIDRLRIFGAGWSSQDPFAHELEADHLPEFLVPGVWDVLIVIGGIAGAIFCVRLALRYVPLPSIWEVGGGVGLRIRRQYLNHPVTVIAKPD